MVDRLEEARLLGQALIVWPVDYPLAREMARLRPVTRSAGLSLGDRACIALARSLSLPALTADRTWSALPLDVEIQVIR